MITKFKEFFKKFKRPVQKPEQTDLIQKPQQTVLTQTPEQPKPIEKPKMWWYDFPQLLFPMKLHLKFKSWEIACPANTEDTLIETALRNDLVLTKVEINFECSPLDFSRSQINNLQRFNNKLVETFNSNLGYYLEQLFLILEDNQVLSSQITINQESSMSTSSDDLFKSDEPTYKTVKTYSPVLTIIIKSGVTPTMPSHNLQPFPEKVMEDLFKLIKFDVSRK